MNIFDGPIKPLKFTPKPHLQARLDAAKQHPDTRFAVDAQGHLSFQHALEYVRIDSAGNPQAPLPFHKPITKGTPVPSTFKLGDKVRVRLSRGIDDTEAEQVQMHRNQLSLIAVMYCEGDVQKALMDACHFLDQAVTTIESVV